MWSGQILGPLPMIHLRRQSLVAYGAPLCETIVDCPAPRGTEVLVRIARCGVCHSDLHMQDGYFKLAGDKRLDITAGRSLPFTLGHEIAGTIEAAGPDVAADASAAAGREVAVYPWIGCGACAACRHGEENLCAAPRHLGIAVDGGYASHVLVPHPRYLLDYAPLTAAQAGTLMCSGLTAFAALKRLTAAAARGPVLLVGLGGVGMMGLGLARTLFASAPLAADIDAGKRAAALAAGAAAVFDPADPAARKAVMAATGGGAYGVCDFVGSDGFARLCDRRARQGRQGRGHGAHRRRLCDGGRDVRAARHDDRGRDHRHARGSAGTHGARARRPCPQPCRSPNGRWRRRRPRSTICAPAAWSAAWC